MKESLPNKIFSTNPVADETLFDKIADAIPDATKRKMFGALCLKAANGKAGAMFWRDKSKDRNAFMIFKLPEKDEQTAMKLTGAQVFEPVEGRRMNGWVQLSTAHSNKWKAYAVKAMAYVKTLEKITEEIKCLGGDYAGSALRIFQSLSLSSCKPNPVMLEMN